MHSAPKVPGCATIARTPTSGVTRIELLEGDELLIDSAQGFMSIELIDTTGVNLSEYIEIPWQALEAFLEAAHRHAVHAAMERS